ncbi:DUF1643 domain-containing protein [Bacillus sp. BD59S]|uniref:DUF1643 domain-containing protein n=1 Tax=Bacillus sp. BD59S TaxID=2499213 RepID=UPI0011810814|nr:DUF1643 domain-containing protein [Bacillus sp. BD59S]QDQ03667.1 DUF1643 domain-containing protein [Bacillus sp. BD59S]
MSEKIITSTAYFSGGSERKHRYSLFRYWSEEKNYATIIMHNPTRKADEIAFDKSIFLAHNYFYNKEYSGYYIVNLYSYRSDSTEGLKGVPFNEKFDSDTDAHIRTAIDNSNDIYIAWGTNTNKVRRINFIKEILKDYNITHVHKLKKLKGKNQHPSRYNKDLKFDHIAVEKI